MIFGIHNHDNLSQYPNVPFKVPLRTWDNNNCGWNKLQTPTINVTPITKLASQYTDLLYTIGTTPSWATSSTLMGKYYQGSDSYPDLLTQSQLTAFLTAIINAGVKYIEPINEVGNGWTAQQIFNWQQQVFQTVKSINPSVKVLSPSFSGDWFSPLLQPVLNLGIEAYVDIWSVHCYIVDSILHHENDMSFGWFEECEDAIYQWRKLVGYEKPIWITEAGNNLTPHTSYEWWKSTIRKLKLLDAERFYFYALDDGIYGFNTPQALAILSRANT